MVLSQGPAFTLIHLHGLAVTPQRMALLQGGRERGEDTEWYRETAEGKRKTEESGGEDNNRERERENNQHAPSRDLKWNALIILEL